MPSILDPETIYVDDLPGIWSPVQWELTPEERNHELEEQARASILWSINIPEAVLRLFLNETQIERAFNPPDRYDPEQQGDWDPDLVTFKFRRSIRLEKVLREPDYLYVEYSFSELGVWALEIEPEKITIKKV